MNSGANAKRWDARAACSVARTWQASMPALRWPAVLAPVRRIGNGRGFEMSTDVAEKQ